MMLRYLSIAVIVVAQYAVCQTGNGSLTGNGNDKKRQHDHTLLSITVAPVAATQNIGDDVGFTATANFSDNTTQDVTTSAAWLSLSPGVATVGSSNDPWPMHCIGAGTATIVATYKGFSSQGALTCTPPTVPTLVSIAVTPASPTQYDGLSIGFTATGTYSDGSHQNITSSVTWASGTPAVASVGPLTATESGNCLTTGSSVLTATDPTTGISGSTTLSCVSVPVTLVSITVTPANTTIYVGTAQNFTATGLYSDGSTQNLTSSAAWSSSNTAVATVGPLTTTEAGNCIAPGAVTITAAYGGINGTTNLTCQVQVVVPTLFSIKLNPQNPSAYDGTSDSFTATGTYSDGSTRVVTTQDPLTNTATVWASGTPSVASLGALTTVQVVNCLTTGASIISATIGAVTGNTTQSCATAPVTLVSIAVTPANPTQYNGSTVAFTATGTYSDGSTQDLTSSAAWTSSNSLVATISANVATCVANSGTSTITATFNAVSGNTVLTCAPAPAAPAGENAYCSSNDDISCFTGNLTDCVNGVNFSGNPDSNLNSYSPVSTTYNAPGGRGINGPIGTNKWLMYDNPFGISTGSGTIVQNYSGTGSMTFTMSLAGLPGAGVDAYPFVLYGCDPFSDCYNGQGSQFPAQLSASSQIVTDINYTLSGTLASRDIDLLFDEWVCNSSHPTNSNQCLEVEILPYYNFVNDACLSPLKTFSVPATVNGVSTTLTFSECKGGNIIFVPQTRPGIASGEVSFDLLPLLKEGVSTFGNSSYQWVSGIELGTEFGAAATQSYALGFTKISISQGTGNVVSVCSQLPQHGIYTGLDGTPSPGSTITVACGGSLQTALNSVVCGQTITYPAMCSGSQNTSPPITLPANSCDAAHWITIETDQTANPNFPPEHTRATPCAINLTSVAYYPNYPCSSPAYLMPQIVSTSSSEPVKAIAGANFYRLIGFDIFGNPQGTTDIGNLVDLSPGADHIIGDRLLLHGQTPSYTKVNGVYSYTSRDVAHGWITQNSTNVALINSSIWNVRCPQGSCTDATGAGLGGNSGTAENVKKLFNNAMTAAGEDYLAGGGGQGFGNTTLTPNDFEIRENYFYKDLSDALANNCRGQHAVVKNDGELKNANRVLIEGNVYENIWTGCQTDQAGYLSLLTPKNQSAKLGGTAAVTSAGAVTATSGTFTSGVVSSGCATPGHCIVTFQSGAYSCEAQSFTDSTHISVGSSCTPAIPSAGLANVAFLACIPGLNPTATVTNVVYRFNDFRNGKHGIQLGAGGSDCRDKSAGIHFIVIHDNLIQGGNWLLVNDSSPGTGQQGFEIFNGQSAPNQIDNWAIVHNTLAQAPGHGNSFSGFDFVLDSTANTFNGSSGSYLDNAIIANNIGPAGGITGYKLGTLYPGGEAAGVKQWGCTPPVTGTTCTWVYARNVLGAGQYTGQINNIPFPSSNLTCDGAGDSCFPSGSSFTNLFTQYNSGTGQPGYRGVYTLTSTFLKAGTDGLNIGVSNWSRWNTLQSGVRSDTTYTAAAISSTSPLPAATHAVPYSSTLTGTSASDMQVWITTDAPITCSGKQSNFPVCGLALSFGGVISGTPTTAGAYTIHVQLMDAAQQYASKTFSLTVN